MVCAPVRRDNPRTLAFYLTCTTITRVDLAHYGVSRAKDWVSVDCGTSKHHFYKIDSLLDLLIRPDFRLVYILC